MDCEFGAMNRYATNGKHSTDCIFYEVKTFCPITMINDRPNERSNDYSLQLKSFASLFRLLPYKTTNLMLCACERLVFWHSIHLDHIVANAFLCANPLHSTFFISALALSFASFQYFALVYCTKCWTINFPLTFWTIFFYSFALFLFFFCYLCKFKFVFLCKKKRKRTY